MSERVNVFVRNDYLAQRYDFFVVRRLGGGMVELWNADPMKSRVQRAENATADYSAPSFSIPHDAAHAVLGALARELGAVEHPEQLRADYEAERKRVDRLIEAVIQR